MPELKRKMSRHANKVTMIVDSFDRYYVEYINSLKFNLFYRKEEKQ